MVERRERSYPPTVEPAPAWFRTLVWDAVLGSLCPLFPIPFVDDMALARVRRRMVGRLAAGHELELSAEQRSALGGGGRRLTVGKLAAKTLLYPIKKIVRKVIYVLAIKEAVDTFSLLFHQGYLFEVALQRGALGHAQCPSDRDVERVSSAVFDTLESTNTRPLGRLVKGVFRSSWTLVTAAGRWLAERMRDRGSISEVEAAGADPERLATESPESEELVSRLVAALWGERDYRAGLERELAARLRWSDVG